MTAVNVKPIEQQIRKQVDKQAEKLGKKRHVVDGPFAESKELVGGFYIIDVESLDEAIGWALRAPSGFGSDDVLEIRQLTGAGDLPPEILKIMNAAAPTWSASGWH